MSVPIIKLDNIDQVPPQWSGPLVLDGPSLDDILLEGDEAVGARIFVYRGGRFHVSPNLYAYGTLKKQPIGASRIVRGFVEKGIGPYEYSYQVSYGGATMASGAWPRKAAIRACKKWIDAEAEARLSGEQCSD